MLHDSRIKTFHEDGFLLGDPILNDSEVDELREEIARVIRDKDRPDVPQPVLLQNLSDDPDKAVWQIVNIWQASEPFRRLIHNPRLVEQLSQLVEAEELRLFHDQIQYKPAQKGGVNWWHQDSIYWPILRPKTAQITAWVALDDVDPDNGCMSMVPGSHRWGDQIIHLHALREQLGPRRFQNLPSEFHGKPVEVRPCPVTRGTVHFHDALTWHGSPANMSGRPRRAIALHFMTEQTRFHAAGEHPMKPFVTVADGEKIQGDAFPLAWSRQSASV